MQQHEKPLMARRFRGYLPVVVDIETSGFNPRQNAVLEIAAVITRMDDQGQLTLAAAFSDVDLDGVSLIRSGRYLDLR